MPRIAEQVLPVTGGVDTHADAHVAAWWIGSAGRRARRRSRPPRPATGPRWPG